MEQRHAPGERTGKSYGFYGCMLHKRQPHPVALIIKKRKKSFRQGMLFHGFIYYLRDHGRGAKVARMRFYNNRAASSPGRNRIATHGGKSKRKISCTKYNYR